MPGRKEMLLRPGTPVLAVYCRASHQLEGNGSAVPGWICARRSAIVKPLPDR
ncbi:MAG TPA: hypothetical protein VGF67_28260 [Ktedonobacteraceae bacterium]